MKALETAKVRSRISHRADGLRRDLDGDPGQRYLGYIRPSRRYNQAVPPDPPASPSTSALTTITATPPPTPPTASPPPDSFDEVYATIPDSALSGIDIYDESQAQDESPPPPHEHRPATPHDHHPPTPTQWDGPSNIRSLIARLEGDSQNPPSFPDTPPPGLARSRARPTRITLTVRTTLQLPGRRHCDSPRLRPRLRGGDDRGAGLKQTYQVCLWWWYVRSQTTGPHRFGNNAC